MMRITSSDYVVIVDIYRQRLNVFDKKKKIRQYPVSTSRYGIGNKEGSHKTPLGWHRVMSKIGGNAPIRTIFMNSRNTYRVAKVGDERAGDLITSRILMLEGLEPGKNKGEGIDSKKRCIYIHGTVEEHLIGQPASHGCIRMRNKDIVELFKIIPRGTLVYIGLFGGVEESSR